MTRIAEIPAYFDDKSFDQFAASFGTWPPDARVLFDARGAQWASPYGLIGLLTAGQALLEAHAERPLFTVPASEDVRRYWARTGFFRHAVDLFEIHGRVPKTPPDEASDVLLGVTPVRASEDVHQVVGKIHPRFGTPHVAIVLCGAWSLVLLLASRGEIGALLSGVVFADWIFFGLGAAAVFALRRSMPDAPRPYRAWGYPVVPAFFVVAAAFGVLSAYIAAPATSMLGTAILATGVIAYRWFARAGRIPSERALTDRQRSD
jgi:hypothetical protein